MKKVTRASTSHFLIIWVLILIPRGPVFGIGDWVGLCLACHHGKLTTLKIIVSGGQRRL